MTSPEMIKYSEVSAEHLAERSMILREYIYEILRDKETYDFAVKIQVLYETFRETLVKDMTGHEFSDVYAQTVVYGFFLARLLRKTFRMTLNPAE